jgi:hypothetical protein
MYRRLSRLGGSSGRRLMPSLSSMKGRSRLLATTSSIQIVSRSKMQPLLQAETLKKAAATAQTTKPSPSDGGSWPRSLVITFFATMSVAVPYTVSWYLSQSGETREQLSGLLRIEDDAVWDPLRRRFGERDYSVPDDENIYKFEDEPNYAVRQDQANVVKRNSGNVTVKIARYDRRNDQYDEPTNETVTVMPASVLARPDSFPSTNGDDDKKRTELIALQFLDADEATQPVTTNDSSSSSSDFSTTTTSTTTTTIRVPYQIFSAWHYQPPEQMALTAASAIAPNNNETTRSAARAAIASELECIEAELAQLEREIQQGRSMDDPYLQHRMQQLQADRRKLLWRRWWRWM